MPKSVVFPLMLLTTGTSLALIAHHITHQGATHPTSQLIAFTKYLAAFIFSSLSVSRSRPAGTANETRFTLFLKLAIGLIDVVAYGLNCLGFPKCGAAISMVVFAGTGQVFTALARLLILRRGMNRQQYLAVVTVTCGLLVRASGGSSALSGKRGGDRDSHLLVGVALITLSALGYSLLGVMYEWLAALEGPGMSHTKVAMMMSTVGLSATSAYVAAFTLPRWDELVANRMTARRLSATPVILLYAAFGACFTLHSLVQGRVLAASGAMTVGVVGALRASAVSVASSLLFCGSDPKQCLTPHAAAGAAIVTLGALLWTFADVRDTQKLSEKTD